MDVSPTGLGPENEWAGKDQQKLKMRNPSSRQRGCYIRTMKKRYSIEEKILAVSLKELGAETN
jgi:hypothetical protein